MVKPYLFPPAELGEDTDRLTTFHLHCKQKIALKSLLKPMFNPCLVSAVHVSLEKCGKGLEMAVPA